MIRPVISNAVRGVALLVAMASLVGIGMAILDTADARTVSPVPIPIVGYATHVVELHTGGRVSGRWAVSGQVFVDSDRAISFTDQETGRGVRIVNNVVILEQ
jgi:hypothetical protein